MSTADLVDDAGLRRRLVARFGTDVEPWLAALPAVLTLLAERWGIEYESLIPRGSMSAVVRCRLADGRRAVLKVSPDRARLATEAAALTSWKGAHAATVVAVDESHGALLTEAIEPGTPLAISGLYPDLKPLQELLASLHAAGSVDRKYPSLAERVAYLFDSSSRLYERHPHLIDVVAPALYERGRVFAARLAGDPSPTVLLHGDLTPSNILDGGERRGLVAIDPAPCTGDPTFDAIDLLLWQADRVDVVETRAEALASATGARADRLLEWCTAFAGMTALERASLGDLAGIEMPLTLARRAAS